MRVRQHGRAVSIPFRCDGPAVRRFMELQMERCDRGRVRLVGRLLREEPRDRVPMLDAAVDHGDGSVAMCPWCKLVAVEDRWLEVESAVRELDLFESQHLPRIEHRVCSQCSVRLKHQLGEYRE